MIPEDKWIHIVPKGTTITAETDSYLVPKARFLELLNKASE